MAEPTECAYTAIFQGWRIPQGVLGFEFRESLHNVHQRSTLGSFVHTVIAVDVGSAAEQRGQLGDTLLSETMTCVCEGVTSGDQILAINGISLKNKTRPEVTVEHLRPLG